VERCSPWAEGEEDRLAIGGEEAKGSDSYCQYEWHECKQVINIS
jgi:hypothetical protein